MSDINDGSFDVVGAMKAGYSAAEVADHLADAKSFDVKAARSHGYTYNEIINHLAGTKLPNDGNGLPAPAHTNVDPTEGMSDGEKFAAGMGKGMTDVVRGVGQVTGLESQGDVDQAKQNDAALMNTGAGKWGSVAGNVAMTLPAALIPGAATIPGAMAAGTAIGGLQPVASDDSAHGTAVARLENMAEGAAGGLGGAVVGRGIGAAAQGAKALLEPFYESGRQQIAGRVLNRFGVEAGDLANVSNAPTITGAQPTLAEQITRPEGAAAAARLQDSLGSVDPQISQRIAGRAMDNNAARVSTLENLAGSGGQRDAAVTARDAQAAADYGSARQAGTNASQNNADAAALGLGNAPNSTPYADLMDRSALRQAIRGAATTASNFGEKLDTANPVQVLHWAKMNLDDKIATAVKQGNKTEAASLMSSKDALLKRLDEISPEYKTAQANYAANSKPVNQMDVAQSVLDKGTTNTTELNGVRKLMPSALTGAVSDEGRLISGATGQTGVTRLSDLLEPEQLTKLNAVVNEVDKAGAVARAGNGPGSATAQRLAGQNILQQTIGPTGLPKSWAESTLLNTLMKPVQWGYNNVAEPKIQTTLADLILNPSKAQEAMASLSPGKRTQLRTLLADPALRSAVRQLPANPSTQKSFEQ